VNRDLPPLQLFAIDGDLYYPPDLARDWRPDDRLIVLCIYPEGDCDSIRWPNPDRKNLHRALFDDRERGIIRDQEVLLPDGTSAWK
jgi:hypothetical protein